MTSKMNFHIFHPDTSRLDILHNIKLHTHVVKLQLSQIFEKQKWHYPYENPLQKETL